jgi:hypothetical protein
MNLQQVHVRVNDAATGKPTPCRVRFTDAQGRYYAPYGRLTEFATQWNTDVGGNVIADGKKYAYIDGACEIALPPGTIHIEVHKGPEYKPLLLEHQLVAGKLSLRLTLERWINLREEGWYSGDTRCHFLTPHAALLEGMAEDLAVVNLLAMECTVPETDDAGERVVGQRPTIANIEAFSGQAPCLEAPGHMVVVNTLNWHPWLGRLALLNCHRVVYPLRFGAPGNDDWTLADWCDQCHRKGGLVVWADTSGPEALANAILGRVDALEVGPDAIATASLAWRTWPGRGALSVVGGSGKASNMVPLGAPRTYALLEPGQQLTYRNWIEAVRGGRTFATRGPLLTLTANGAGPGAVVRGSAEIRVRATARSGTPFARLRVAAGETVISEVAPTGSPFSAAVETTFSADGPTVVFAWCDEQEQGFSQCAWTTPIRIEVTGSAKSLSPGANALGEELRWRLALVENEGRFSTDAQRQRLRQVFEDALRVLG